MAKRRFYGQGAKRHVAPTSPRRRILDIKSGELKEGPENRADYEDRTGCEDVTPEWVKERPWGSVRTPPPTKRYERGWERIFGKKTT